MVFMKLAVAFPGQGSQKVGMGLDLYNESKITKDLFERANITLGRDISKIIFEGPLEELNQTKNTQIAIVLVSIALTMHLKEELKQKKILFEVSACCGHSLGELTALWFLNIINLEDLIKLVSIRGNLMQNAPRGGMAAILNLSEENITKVLTEEGLTDKIVIANYNTPAQFVISGDKEVFEKGVIQEKIKTLGGKTIILPVSGAFHSPLMENPAIEFAKEIDKIFVLSRAQSKNTKIPIYQNTDGKPSCSYKDIKEKIKKQITSPVFWTQTINNLVKDGVTSIVEIGPGKVLTGLIKKINPNIECFNISDLQSLREFTANYECKFTQTKLHQT